MLLQMRSAMPSFSFDAAYGAIEDFAGGRYELAVVIEPRDRSDAA